MMGTDPEATTPNVQATDVDREVKRVDLASQIAQLEAYRTELVSETERAERLIQFFREKLKELMQHGTYTIGPTDDEYDRERERTERKRAVGGNVRDNITDRPH